jgi:hypothetical protein
MELIPWVIPSQATKRSQNLMGTVAREVKAIKHPVEFLNRQDDRFVGGVR